MLTALYMSWKNIIQAPRFKMQVIADAFKPGVKRDNKNGICIFSTII